jgi:hypothetical protein
MRLPLACAALVLVLGTPASAFAQQPDQPQQPPVNEEKVKEHAAAATQMPAPAPSIVPPSQIAAQTGSGDSLAAAARKAREQKKEQAQAKPREFDNDNIPKQGGVSAVGQTADAATDGTTSAAASNAAAAPVSGVPGPNDEKGWRDMFGKLRHKLEQDQDSVSVMQRELGVLDVQYYNDPVKGMQQGLTRSDINAKTAKIDAAKQQVEADKQAISDAEDQLRRAGGDIGWSR